ncbi:Putative GDP/GTP exchange factor Sec2, guanine nucleotide exchange factor RAB3IL/RAB3IP/Sec2 [Septoria linicola]|uniref:GDP/GTP exchange factor Sec2, guanine nucleotide exchange factor RAB3IL/RAB3IP/Sec2 n=1 Tax=Septoria linicola TaxID=215465 RepID=A0A9Q9AIA5_9PEZI|nr:putative GDP/GTP exchange factor Sec2, guanine nucleotide exchange factor RAB3IL/RAB3IP/Sec2 [Septoria linicola]USW49909.1 Putative GDP/GTP exchange factor Sec2, guanine nucleotide exchange factor RAB3IL/RAB3IP/Sec2 [Septoria linicola]
MASNTALPNGVHAVTRRHGAHDSTLDDDEHKDYNAAQRRITELEEENGLLAEKATAASLRFVDYENELRVLRETLRHHQQLQHQRQGSTSSSKSDEHPHSAPPAAQFDRPGLGRFGSFMRKASGNSLAFTESAHEHRHHELEASLIKEQTARIAAETKLKEVNSEVEELSASLFQQANDMVAAERRENAVLRDKIKSLEESGTGSASDLLKKENERLQQKVDSLEQREVDRKRRLEKLEAAQKRIDRVRMMLAPR